MTPTDNTDKMMTKRVRSGDGTTLVLNYRKPDAHALRALVQSIRLKGNKSPSLSLLARRSMQVYVTRLETARQARPDIFAAEVAELERMVTPTPKPAPRSKKAPG